MAPDQAEPSGSELLIGILLCLPYSTRFSRAILLRFVEEEAKLQPSLSSLLSLRTGEAGDKANGIDDFLFRYNGSLLCEQEDTYSVKKHMKLAFRTILVEHGVLPRDEILLLGMADRFQQVILGYPRRMLPRP